MATYRKVSWALGATALIAILIGCEREGPMERTGKKLDEAVENLNATTKKEGPAEKTGKKIDEVTKEMEEKIEKETGQR